MENGIGIWKWDSDNIHFIKFMGDFNPLFNARVGRAHLILTDTSKLEGEMKSCGNVILTSVQALIIRCQEVTADDLFTSIPDASPLLTFIFPHLSAGPSSAKRRT